MFSLLQFNMCEQINDNDDDNDVQDGIGSDKKKSVQPLTVFEILTF